MEISPYRQTTCESCLPVCLLMVNEFLTGKRFGRKEETELMSQGLLDHERNYAVGMLIAAKKLNGMKFKFWIRGPKNRDYVRSELPKDVDVFEEEISIELIDKLLEKKKPVIILTDGFYFGIEGHWTHYVVISENLGKNYAVYNPWTGKKEISPKKLVSKALSQAWNKLLFATMIIETK